MAKVSFNNKQAVFYTALKQQVDEYFKQKHIKKTGNWKLYLKSAILLPTALISYILLLTIPFSFWPGLLLSLLLGFTMAFIGFNVMHDACHGSFSESKMLNSIFSYTTNALGSNAFLWKIKHNVIHHTYTNIDGVDDDIAKSPVLRHCHTQKWLPFHRAQHIYLPVVYALSSFLWVLFLDYIKYFNQKIVSTPITTMNRKEHFIFWASKILYIVFYIVVPVLCVGWQAWAIGFFAMHAALGFTMAIVFQLAHVVEDTQFDVLGTENKNIENEWAIHQVVTTANFATNNKVISWFLGGLNYQIEHHLFPRISHVHYPALSKIVKDTCDKFNVSYNYFPTMSSAIVSHFKMMKQFGKKPQMQLAG